MSELVACWFYTRPRVRRLWFLVQTIWGTSVIAVATAPTATADTLGAAWSFTGLHDSYGIPIGQHFVSMPPLIEMVGASGPDFGVNPETWGPAIMASLNTAMTYTQLSLALASFTAFLIGVCSIGIWLIKFALGVLWLAWLGAIAAPIVATMKAIIERMHLLAGGVLMSVMVGGIVCLTTGFGAGIGIILGSLLALALFWLFLRDPAGELISDNGILGIGRSLGFAVAQGVVHNGPVAAGGTSAQLDTLTSWMVDVLVRDVIQLINFGQVIDNIPGCAAVYNGALLQGGNAAQAIRVCAPDAYAHALHLDATTVGLFLICNLCVLVILWALDYMGVEAFRVGFKAFWNLFIVVPAVAAAAFPGPPRQFAKKSAARVLLHGAEMMAATAGLGILVMIIAGVTRGTLPGTIGMTAPLAKVLVMMLIAVIGSLGFRFVLLHAFGDKGIPGPVRALRGGYRGVTGTARTVNEVEYSGRVINGLRGRLKDRNQRSAAQGQGQGEHGGNGPKPPGRKGHPPTAGPGRSFPTGPGRESGSAAGPTPARPGRSPGGGGAATKPTTTPVPTGKVPAPVGATAGRAAAGRTAAEVAAPEVAVPVAAATSLAHHAAGARQRHNNTTTAPGRRGANAGGTAAQQHNTSPGSSPNATNTPGLAEQDHDLPTTSRTSDFKAPGRTTPNP